MPRPEHLPDPESLDSDPEGVDAPGRDEVSTNNHIHRRRLLQLGLLVGATACSGEVTVSLSSPERSSTSDANAATGSESGGEPVLDPFGPLPVGTLDDLAARLRGNAPVSLPEADAWLVAYPGEHVEAAKAVYPESVHPGLDAGLLVLHWKCTHLGCRVPACETSGIFECPCHGSIYSAVGEYRAGPAPRGLDLFPLVFEGSSVQIDRGGIERGLSRDVDITGSAATGPSCLEPGE